VRVVDQHVEMVEMGSKDSISERTYPLDRFRRASNELAAWKVSFAVSSSAWCAPRLDAQLVVNSVHDPLPGAEVSFRGLHGPVS
jgi:hypothetical protein